MNHIMMTTATNAVTTYQLSHITPKARHSVMQLRLHALQEVTNLTIITTRHSIEHTALPHHTEIGTVSVLVSSRCMHISEHTHTHDRFTARCPGLPGWAGTRRNIHPLTPLLLIIFLHLPRTIASSLLNPRTWQSLQSIHLTILISALCSANCLNLFHPTQTLASTAASSSPSTLSMIH